MALACIFHTQSAFSPLAQDRNCLRFGASDEFMQARSNLPNGKLPKPGIREVVVGWDHRGRRVWSAAEQGGKFPG